MNSHVVLYINGNRSAESPAQQVSAQAQLIACRLYAAARGFIVDGVHMNPGGEAHWAKTPESLVHA